MRTLLWRDYRSQLLLRGSIDPPLKLWHLAFRPVSLALVDFDFAKGQLLLMLRNLYAHPNGQIPAYEWNFSDVKPPVHEEPQVPTQQDDLKERMLTKAYQYPARVRCICDQSGSAYQREHLPIKFATRTSTFKGEFLAWQS